MKTLTHNLAGMFTRLSCLILILSASVGGGQAAEYVFKDFSNTGILTLNGDATVLNTGDGCIMRLVAAQRNRNGGFFSTAPIRVATFSAFFTFRLTNPGGVSDPAGSVGADGLMFVVQTVTNRLGGIGGGMGFFGLTPSVGIEFDTFLDTPNNDPDSNHIGIDTNGVVRHDPSGANTVHVTPNFDDGNIWYVWVDYDGTNLEVRANETGLRPNMANLAATMDIAGLLGQSNAFVGITAGTGDSWENHDVLSLTYRDNFNPFLSPQITSILGGNAVVYQGVPWAFTALIAGSSPFGYQWSLSGANLADSGRVFGTQSNLLSFTNVLASDAGTYQLAVSNAFGVATSSVTLTVLSSGCYPVPSGAVAWFPGNSNALDIVGANHGTVNGGVTYAPGMVGQAFNCDGSTGYIDAGNSPALNLSGPITLETWVYPTRADLCNEIIQKATIDHPGYQLRMDSGHMSFLIGSAGAVDWTGGPILPLNQWSHLAGTFDGLTMKAYLNGQLVVSKTTSVALAASSSSLKIGRREDGWYFKGMIDDPGIYNRALTEGEIRSIYLAGSAGKCANPPAQLVMPQMGTNFSFGIQTISGQSYTVLSSTNLSSTNWSFYTNVLGDGSYWTVPVPAANLSQEFFRVRAP